MDKHNVTLNVRVPRSLINLWARRGEVARFLLKQLTPNVGSVVLAMALFWTLGARAAPWGADANATAAIPPMINYQGRIADSSGAPIDATDGLYMTFALYATQEGGTPLWSDAYNVPVSDGLFSVRLGSGTLPLTNELLNGERWLGIQVGSDPEMTPRERLTAVPYAMQAGYAAEAATVPDGSITPEKLAISSEVDFGDQKLVNLRGIEVPFNIQTGRSWQFTQYDTGPGTKTALKPLVDNKWFQFRTQDDQAILGIYAVNDGVGYLDMFGHSIRNVGAIVEANLQTPEELAAETIDRFSEGDVLCWQEDRLEACAITGDPLVQAVADAQGKPIVIGAEVIKVVGSVQRGDLLVASDVPGHAVVDNNPQPGSVIAQALEDFDGERGLIKAMIRKF